MNQVAIRAGSFGNINTFGHNVYECYISPLITAGRVEATRDNNVNWIPLPEGSFPAGTHPTQNLLGNRPVDNNSEERSRLGGIMIQEEGIPWNEQFAR